MNCSFCNELAEPQFLFCEACGKPLVADVVVGDDLPAVENDNAAVGCIRCGCGSSRFDSDGYCEACGHRSSPLDAIDVLESGVQAASASHRGRHHSDNQDSVLMQELPNGFAIALADGVSTSCHARAAADIAVQTALKTLQDCGSLPTAERMRLATQRAHEAVCTLPHDNLQLAEPQATLVLALVEGMQVWYSWVGDSRLYMIDQAEVIQLTMDDSWLNAQVNTGVPIAAALKDINAHCITQCLGMRDDEVDIHIATQRLSPDAILLLCSDGLWNYCDEPKALRKLLNEGNVTDSLARRCVKLIDYANAAGGQDNITVAMYRHRCAG
ncbi:PP2C family protein-serine/threonine phosphatase [Solimicrobium silvestre]|uniref:Serine/threonine protein phosphatase n=1 Tax=Solimicrobium silvestre TaxID=2099400 RepID=A0A2S9GT09_9BURK|nr:protein phosphatase 2C domain-containing protein [Solimicrobium silvestre]PRC90828.1 Serine/threonine protein phosphatase [Solimicrobium silvestre]